jgi:curli biogenesis system outer membrane secretion channel CsgG
MTNSRNISALLLIMLFMTSCAGTQEDLRIINGPPIQDIETHFDVALKCLNGKTDPAVTFSVGMILDSTGKEQITEGGTGKFATQGAGDIVQSALFKAGVSLVNRRDPRIMTTEIQMGLMDSQHVLSSNYFITGSINTLDFIPGGGVKAEVAGGGPRFLQSRIFVGLDLFVTETSTGKIVACIPLQKQIVANEAAFSLVRFFGTTLVNVDIGGKEREVLQFTLRQMLHLATFEVLTQLMSDQNYAECKREIDPLFAIINETKTGENTKTYHIEKEENNVISSTKEHNGSYSRPDVHINRQNNENSQATGPDDKEASTNNNGDTTKNSGSYYLDEKQKTTLPRAGVLW